MSNTMDKTEIVGSVEITAKWNFEREAIDNLLVTAFEGGINYWCYKIDVSEWPEDDEAKWASHVVSRGKTITLHVDDETEDGDPVTCVLGLKDILGGIKQFCEMRELNPATLFDPYTGDYDADDADQIVQYACFGKVVFG